MKTTTRAAAFGGLLMLMLLSVGGTAVSLAGERLTLGGSPEIPAAEGEARLKVTRNGNTEIKLTVKHLAPPGRITPGADVFVVWVRGLAAGSLPQSLGALKIDGNLSGKLTGATALASFDLFLTAEASQTVTVPATLELMPLHYAKP